MGIEFLNKPPEKPGDIKLTFVFDEAASNLDASVRNSYLTGVHRYITRLEEADVTNSADNLER